MSKAKLKRIENNKETKKNASINKEIKLIDKLKEREQRYRAIFYNMDEAFAICELIENVDKTFGNDFRIIEINKYYERAYGVKAKDVIGKTPAEISDVYKDYMFPYRKHGEKFKQFLKNGKSYRFEHHNFRTNLDFIVHVFRIDETKFAFMSSNVTSERRLRKKISDYSHNLEKLVELRTEQLKEKERLAAIGETAGMVGHDIRNPLQAIIGDLYLLRSECNAISGDARKKSALESIRSIDENIYYINKIISDLQDYTRQLKACYKIENIADLIKKILSDIKIPQNIETELPNKDLKIKVDRDYIKRIITNLALNAIQAMPNGGKLTIEVYTKKSDYFIVISDTGIGIPEEIRPRLFSPLFTTKSKGQGFGLSVVKRIIEALGGSISFESEKGKGTKFIVRLPLIFES